MTPVGLAAASKATVDKPTATSLIRSSPKSKESPSFPVLSAPPVSPRKGMYGSQHKLSQHLPQYIASSPTTKSVPSSEDDDDNDDDDMSVASSVRDKIRIFERPKPSQTKQPQPNDDIDDCSILSEDDDDQSVLSVRDKIYQFEQGPTFATPLKRMWNDVEQVEELSVVSKHSARYNTTASLKQQSAQATTTLENNNTAPPQADLDGSSSASSDDDDKSVLSVREKIDLFQQGPTTPTHIKRTWDDVDQVQELSVVSKQSSLYNKGNHSSSHDSVGPSLSHPRVMRRSSLGPGLYMNHITGTEEEDEEEEDDPLLPTSASGGSVVQPGQQRYEQVILASSTRMPRRASTGGLPSSFMAVTAGPPVVVQPPQATTSSHHDNIPRGFTMGVGCDNDDQDDMSSLGSREDDEEDDLLVTTRSKNKPCARFVASRQTFLEQHSKQPASPKLAQSPRRKLVHGTMGGQFSSINLQESPRSKLIQGTMNGKDLPVDPTLLENIPRCKLETLAKGQCNSAAVPQQQPRRRRRRRRRENQEQEDEPVSEHRPRRRANRFVQDDDGDSDADNDSNYNNDDNGPTTTDENTPEEHEFDMTMYDELGYISTDDDEYLAPKHRVLSRRFGRRASTGRVIVDDTSPVLEVSDTHATFVSVPQVFLEDMKDHDGSAGTPRRRGLRRHSIGSVRTLSSSQDSVISTEDFWQMYEPKKDDAPPEAAYTKRRGVRFKEDVTVWVFPNEGNVDTDLPLAATWVRASPETDREIMQIPLRKTEEEKIADLQQKAAEHQTEMYKDDDSVGSLELKPSIVASGSIDESFHQSSHFGSGGNWNISDEESLSPKQADELISSFHESSRFESTDGYLGFEIPQNMNDDKDPRDLCGLQLRPSSFHTSFHFEESGDECSIADDASMPSMQGGEFSAPSSHISEPYFLDREGESLLFDGESSNPCLDMPLDDVPGQRKSLMDDKIESPTAATECLYKPSSDDVSIDSVAVMEVSENPESPKPAFKRNEKMAQLPGFHDSFESMRSEDLDVFEDKSVVSNEYEPLQKTKNLLNDQPANDDALIDTIMDKVKQELDPEIHKRKTKKSLRNSSGEFDVKMVNRIVEKVKEEIGPIKNDSKSAKASSNSRKIKVKTMEDYANEKKQVKKSRQKRRCSLATMNIVELANVVPAPVPEVKLRDLPDILKKNKQKRRSSLATATDVDIEIWKIEKLQNRHEDFEVPDFSLQAQNSFNEFDKTREAIFRNFEASFSSLQGTPYPEVSISSLIQPQIASSNPSPKLLSAAEALLDLLPQDEPCRSSSATKNNHSASAETSLRSIPQNDSAPVSARRLKSSSKIHSRSHDCVAPPSSYRKVKPKTTSRSYDDVAAPLSPRKAKSNTLPEFLDDVTVPLSPRKAKSKTSSKSLLGVTAPVSPRKAKSKASPKTQNDATAPVSPRKMTPKTSSFVPEAYMRNVKSELSTLTLEGSPTQDSALTDTQTKRKKPNRRRSINI
eukprot:scaffold1513_cov100-Amphora_coffeaeformis.AAC.5